jgi:hypothetical protein
VNITRVVAVAAARARELVLTTLVVDFTIVGTPAVLSHLVATLGATLEAPKFAAAYTNATRGHQSITVTGVVVSIVDGTGIQPVVPLNAAVALWADTTFQAEVGGALAVVIFIIAAFRCYKRHTYKGVPKADPDDKL